MTIYSTERTAKNAVETMPESYLKYFKGSKIHLLNDDFLKNYRASFS